MHLGTWIGFDTEGHKPVYEAMLKRSGAKLRQASTTNENIAVRERFTNDHAAVLFVGNYYNEEQPGKVTYSHPESGEAITIPYLQEDILWPALYGVLSPICLQVSDGIKMLHSTSDILVIRGNEDQLEITLCGDRDLQGEMVFEGANVERINTATLNGEAVKIYHDGKRVAFKYFHKHNQEIIIIINIKINR